jgi:hypothetical protein
MPRFPIKQMSVLYQTLVINGVMEQQLLVFQDLV